MATKRLGKEVQGRPVVAQAGYARLTSVEEGHG